MSDRTPEEREAARRERERRRAEKEGRPLPPEPAPPVPEPPGEASADLPWSASADPPPAGEDPPATQQYDVTADWAPEPAATAVAESLARERPAGAAATGEHAAADAGAQLAAEPETPLGTRRVTALERFHTHGRRSARGGSVPPRGPGRARGGGGRRRLWRRGAAALVVALVIAAGWFLVSLYQPFTGDGGARVVVKIPQGASASAIGDQLAREGVVSSAFFFDLRAKLAGVRGDLRSGSFMLRHGMSYGAALDALTTAPAPPPVTRVVIPEGRSRSETAAIARADGLRGNYAAASRRSPLLSPRRYGAPRDATLEGFLFPATYELRPHANVKTLIAAQLTALRRNLATVSLRAARHKNLTTFDVLTIASMVEREVSVAKERPLVAAVIYNRLHDGMPLGIDATLRFALGDWTHPLRQSQLANPTPYNTRIHPGLPPGPIGNPGLASIQAAAHPAKVHYLFYVVKPGRCGEHAFSSTDAQFQRDVARYNAARKAAGGKSPEKC